jgi:menaquinone-dependent protoporphyrinogen IX oxidase
VKNFRFLLSDQFQANEIAEDLQVQLEINRFNHVKVTAVEQRNEVLVQVPEANGSLEEAVESFMRNYQDGEVLE